MGILYLILCSLKKGAVMATKKREIKATIIDGPSQAALIMSHHRLNHEFSLARATAVKFTIGYGGIKYGGDGDEKEVILRVEVSSLTRPKYGCDDWRIEGCVVEHPFFNSVYSCVYNLRTRKGKLTLATRD
jgi:hypothetical protein